MIIHCCVCVVIVLCDNIVQTDSTMYVVLLANSNFFFEMTLMAWPVTYSYSWSVMLVVNVEGRTEYIYCLFLSLLRLWLSLVILDLSLGGEVREYYL